MISSVNVRGSRPCSDGMGNDGQRSAGIVFDERLDELVERCGLGRFATAGGDELERRDGVARRAATLAKHRLHRCIGDVDAGIGGEPADVLLEHVHRQQMELQVLGSAADGVADLLRVGGREDEHDVRRRFLQRLQQRSLGRLRQHVHLVEDVHLVATGRAERGLLDEVAHRIDAVVAGRVELVHVVAGATFDRDARIAFAARLAVDRSLAVEHLGEDPADVVLPVPRGPENR